MPSETKVWFITGCSSGFGLCITELALQKGDKVVATLRKSQVLSDLVAKYPERLLVLKLDVTKPADVVATFAASQAKFGHIDVVVNNTEFVVMAETEGAADTARCIFKMNFWGASHVSREAVRHFCEENTPMGGRLLQVSSIPGIHATPGAAYYCASARSQLDPKWNIKCPTVNAIVEPVSYTNPALPTMQWRALLADRGDTLFDGDPVKFADAVYKAACLGDPPLRLPIHNATLDFMREKGKHLLDTADKWVAWSKDVLLEDDET